MNQTQKFFQQLLANRGIECTDYQCSQFEIYYRTLVEWNRHMNLTAITNHEEVYIKHFYDSISVRFFHSFESVRRIADIGSGAGFPSIPLLILLPDLEVTIIDSLKKRIHFLTTLCEKIGFKNVQCIHGRAEDVARIDIYRDQFDLVTARAVARLPVLNELCLPYVRQGGYFIAMKGADYQNELSEATRSLQRLRGVVEDVHTFELPSEQALRAHIVIRKTAPTPEMFPRKAGVPNKEPLL